MKLEIDNFDGAGVCDYTAWLDGERRPRVLRKLNTPATMTCALAGEQLMAPAAGARIALRNSRGQALFTGYVVQAPECEYLGWGQTQATYRYAVHAIGDEVALDRTVLAARPAFVMRTAGEILREITDAAAPGAFDVADVADGDVITQFAAGLRKWSDCAQSAAKLTRMAYFAHDGQISLRPIGSQTLSLDESQPEFSPERLKVHSPDNLANDLTVLGKSEPDAYVKDYFLGDGYATRFYMSQVPYGSSTSTIFEQEYDGTIDPAWWGVTDAGGVVSVNSGRLWMQGGAAEVDFAEKMELKGAIAFQHGDLQFQSASDGVIGGLYDGASCVAGFRIAKAGAQSQISVLINDAAAGQSLATQTGHRYVLSTRMYATETVRENEKFHSSESTQGGGDRTADARMVLEVHDIDPNNPVSLVSAATVLYDGVITGVPAFCRYALLSAIDMHCSLAYTRVMRLPNAVVRSALPNGDYRTRLAGAMVDGAECRVYNGELQFFPANLPASNEKIIAEYRGARRSLAQVQDAASIARDGVRSNAVVGASPAIRTSSDCGNAGLAILEDSTRQAWSGAYETWSDFLPDDASDIWPGDQLDIAVPSRDCDTSAIVREVEVQAIDPANDRSWYAIRFANEAAEPIAIQTTPATAAEVASATARHPERFVLENLPQAAVTAITSTSVTMDMGKEAIAGGGFEVRRTDSGWDPQVDRNLVGRFNTRAITVPRLSRVQTYSVRQYDNSNPVRYSRCATQLHVDYPL